MLLERTATMPTQVVRRPPKTFNGTSFKAHVPLPRNREDFLAQSECSYLGPPGLDRTQSNLRMSEGTLVGKTMHWIHQLQGLKDAQCITCVHKAGARNSLIYLTGLETPDQ